MNMKGWHGEPQRHSLAARGCRTVPTKYRKKGYEVYRDGVYQGFTESREEAEEHVDEFGGNVVHSMNRKEILYRGRGVRRGIPMISNYEYETGQSAIEIAQNYVDSIENLFPRLKDPRSYTWAEDRRKFKGFLMFMYDYQFDSNEIAELQGVVMDMFRETKSGLKR